MDKRLKLVETNGDVKYWRVYEYKQLKICRCNHCTCIDTCCMGPFGWWVNRGGYDVNLLLDFMVN